MQITAEAAEQLGEDRLDHAGPALVEGFAFGGVQPGGHVLAGSVVLALGGRPGSSGAAGAAFACSSAVLARSAAWRARRTAMWRSAGSGTRPSGRLRLPAAALAAARRW